MNKDNLTDLGDLEDRLSFSMKKRTEALIDKKRQIDNALLAILLLLALLALGFIYIISRSTLFLSMIQYYIRIDSFSTLMLGIVLFSFIAISTFISRFNKLKKDYQKIIDDILKVFEKDICKCSNTCSCKDDYVKYLYDRKIKIFQP